MLGHYTSENNVREWERKTRRKSLPCLSGYSQQAPEKDSGELKTVETVMLESPQFSFPSMYVRLLILQQQVTSHLETAL